MTHGGDATCRHGINPLQMHGEGKGRESTFSLMLALEEQQKDLMTIGFMKTVKKDLMMLEANTCVFSSKRSISAKPRNVSKLS